MNSDSKEINQNILFYDNGNSDDIADETNAEIDIDSHTLEELKNVDSSRIVEDPSLWTWLPNSSVSSDEEDYLLLRHGENNSNYTNI